MSKLKPSHISREAWDAVEAPPLTDEKFSRLRPAREVDPEAVEAYLRMLGSKKQHRP